MALLDDVIDFLDSAGLVNDGSDGWQGFKSYLPPSPDRVLAVFETPGLEAEGRKPGTGETPYDSPGFQIRIRGDRFGYEAMRARLQAVFESLHEADLNGVTTGSPQWLLCRAVQSGPLPLGLDESGRPGATWNFQAIRERGA